MQPNSIMKISRRNFLLCVALFVAISASANGGEKMQYRSPNGKFAMRLTEDGSELVEIKSGKTLIQLEEAGAGWAKDSKLVWSPDSKYVAHFSEDRRGGSTTIYRQSGDNFEAVQLPEFPQCEKTNVGKEFEASTEPKRWLNENTLTLLAREAWSNEDDANQTTECEQLITIAFDTSGKASIKTVKTTKK
jgi:hypothetical protein